MSRPDSFSCYGVTLKPLTEDMLETVRCWRNSPVIAEQMLDKHHITAEEQQAWFARLQDDPHRAYWVAWFKDEPIGVASLVDISTEQGTAAPGMYIYTDRYRNNIVPFCVAFALNDLAFELLGLDCLFGKIYQSNVASLRFHQKSGYRIVDSQGELILLQLTRADYQEARAPIAKYIRY